MVSTGRGTMTSEEAVRKGERSEILAYVYYNDSIDLHRNTHA